MMVCKHFPKCGGCNLQNLSYKEQLALKISEVKKLFEKFKIRLDFEIKTSPKKWFYRNKMDFVVVPGPKIGLRERGRWYSVVDIENCLLMSEWTNKIRNDFREFIKEYNLSPYDLHKKKGNIRYLVLREGKNSGKKLIIIITKEDFIFNKYIEYIKDKKISVCWAINNSLADIAKGDIIKFYGSQLTEIIANTTFRISPFSFFQSNSYVAEEIIKTIKKFAYGETLIDLYCGVGLFGLSLSKNFSKVIGIELEKSAVEDAKYNAKINKIDNFKVIRENVNKIKEFNTDTIIVDPPRQGLGKKVIKKILQAKPKNLIYVSCNPKTFLQDLIDLIKNYELKEGFIFDMFPWTSHIEIVSNLKLKFQ